MAKICGGLVREIHPPTAFEVGHWKYCYDGGNSRRKLKNEVFEIKKGAKSLERKEELMKLVNDDNACTVVPLIDKLLFLEGQLEGLEKLPMIRVNPANPQQQRATPAAKLYREFLQQYTNVVKVISKATNTDENAEDSPLRKWVKSRNVD